MKNEVLHENLDLKHFTIFRPVVVCGSYWRLLWVNDRLGGVGGNAPHGMVQGYFWNFIPKS